MNALIIFITFLVQLLVGAAALALFILLLLVVAVYTYKAGKLLIALANAAIKEPEEKIVKKVWRLNKKK